MALIWHTCEFWTVRSGSTAMPGNQVFKAKSSQGKGVSPRDIGAT